MVIYFMLQEIILTNYIMVEILLFHRAPRRPAPNRDCSGSSGLNRGQPDWEVPGNLAVAYRVRASAGDLPAFQLYQHDPARYPRIGVYRRRVELYRLYAVDFTAVDSVDRLVYDFSVPLGLERLSGCPGYIGRREE